MALAQAFGCARVVYNDALRLREQCLAAGEKVSSSEVQRRVITLARLTPERAWLSEVPSVALVQACNDARRAYQNWFGSLSGVRKGRRVGHPVFRREHGRQSVRLTRNGVQPARAAAVRSESRRNRRPVVPATAVGTVECHGHPRTGWPVLRLLRRGTTRHATSRVWARGRH
jgi:hypothetical protein